GRLDSAPPVHLQRRPGRGRRRHPDARGRPGAGGLAGAAAGHARPRRAPRPRRRRRADDPRDPGRALRLARPHRLRGERRRAGAARDRAASGDRGAGDRCADAGTGRPGAGRAGAPAAAVAQGDLRHRLQHAQQHRLADPAEALRARGAGHGAAAGAVAL
ncbi:MAG: hypothetical protein AVDCRST_MAG27-1469, partial [uncultured Craurococcus sp.]